MKIFKLLAILAALGGSALAQTYSMDKTPFRCYAATSRGDIPLSFYQFDCRGIFYNKGTIELFFNGGAETMELISSSGTWTGSLSLTNFTQPNPFSCPVRVPGYIAGCPPGTTPGKFSFSWWALDSANNVHAGSVTGTWENVQHCGGTRCWYYPTLESADLTVN